MKNCKSPFIFLLIAIAAAAALVFTPLTNHLYSLMEVPGAEQEADAILLLASGTYTREILDRKGYQRLFKAFRLYTDGYADKIVVCGGPQRDWMAPRSEIMKEMLVEIGAKSADILTETSSQSTYENIRNAMPILKRLGAERVLLVTSSSHACRSMAVCERLGVTAYPAPVECYEKDIDHFVSRSRFVLDLLREYAAIIYYKMEGWI